MVKSGRTHLMDATPVTLGQEFGGYAAQVRYGVERLQASLPRLGRAAAGRHRRRHRHQHPCRASRRAVIAEARRATGLPLTEARNHFEAQGARDGAGRGVRASCATIAVGLFKIANDLRWMGSGPRTGPRRDRPARPAAGQLDHAGQGQPGDPRGARTWSCAQVIGNDAAVAFAGAAGNFELNVMLPVMAPQPARVDPAAGQHQPAARRPLIDGIEAERRALPRARRVLAVASSRRSTSTSATRRRPRSPSSRSRSSKTIRQVVARAAATSSRASSPRQQLDAALDVLSMTHP